MCDSCLPPPPAARLMRPNRRHLLALGLGGVVLGGQLRAFAEGGAPEAAALTGDECAPFNAGMQAVMTPDEAVERLIAGHQRFQAGASLQCDLRAEALATAEKQTPFACILSCIDSRVAPELIFNQQIGDIFCARVAGNVPTTEIVGSFEYATKVAGAKAIMVLGHSHCGAVKGAIDEAEVGDNLTDLLRLMEPAIQVTPLEGERSSHNHPFVEAVAQANVRVGVQTLLMMSAVIRELVEAGELRLVGAYYDIDTLELRLLETGT